MNSRITLSILAAILAVSTLYLTVFRSDPLVEALNQAIQANGSPELKKYPYPFKVLRMEGTAAVMNTPRSPAMPVYRMIGAIDPALRGKAPDNPDFVAAEKALAKIQSEARQIVLSQPGVTDVKWELDKNWLISHQIALD
ncbi:hypothetical protein SCD_n01738 [Sulfuricella denitrificans skB26]|uniref:Glutamate-ammonia-ligase adenylyltransferase n=1 Tax=Sulfuricella denitrificans (strain DSM 22764 / NBRC 105220 / skB26) TaxID=1163617 RepID=S6ACG2_SULDS|nr:hypothetical protein [Sulfuricella denitrificans]BAN35553.1 hypothetical protein SCD_n01738 [Sulfuricella denitrificans skB26]